MFYTVIHLVMHKVVRARSMMLAALINYFFLSFLNLDSFLYFKDDFTQINETFLTNNIHINEIPTSKIL